MISSSDDNVIIIGSGLIVIEERKRRKRQYWVHDIFRAREEEGEFHTLFNRLKSDNQKFVKYFRMSIPKFQTLLELIKPDIERSNSKWRQSICPTERLAVCLRFLATGSSQASISFSYRISQASVCRTVSSTCEVIWKNLHATELPKPSEEIWKKKAEEFHRFWQFPNCIGAIDGKHVEIQAPHNSGSLYYNYKKTFSVVLLAIVDANYKFICIDVGGYGKSCDGGLFIRSELGKRLEEETLNVPGPTPLGNTLPLPHVIVGDEAFPLIYIYIYIGAFTFV